MNNSRPKPLGSVFLIGMMCSGKSTVGRLLAPLLYLPFLDLDREVESRVGPLLPFVQREGEKAFRLLETETLDAAITGPDAVISTGGGTPCFNDNLERMRARGSVVLLHPSFEVLMTRIERSGGDRPLLFGLKGDALRVRVAELLADRHDCYEGAHLRIESDGAAAEVAGQLADALRSQAR